MTDELLRELDARRDDFVAALGDVDADLVTAPGVVGEWSVRDLVVHVAAWAEHAAHALDLAADGRGSEFAYSTGETDAMNERILAEARTTAPSAALAREEAAYSAFRQRVEALDPSLLRLVLGNGDSVADVIRYDGPDHYAEHAGHLRAWFDGSDGPSDEEGG